MLDHCGTFSCPPFHPFNLKKNAVNTTSIHWFARVDHKYANIAFTLFAKPSMSDLGEKKLAEDDWLRLSLGTERTEIT